MYADINKHNGQNTNPLEHLAQSISDILTTPLYTRLARRTYGSEIPLHIDSVDNPSNRLRLYTVAATALMQWEPRLQLTRIQVCSGTAEGKLVLAIDGYALINGQSYELNRFIVR